MNDIVRTKTKTRSPSLTARRQDLPIEVTSDQPLVARPNNLPGMGRTNGQLMAGMNDAPLDGPGLGRREVEQPVTTMPAVISKALSTSRQGVKAFQMANIIGQWPTRQRAQLERAGRELFSQQSERKLTMADIFTVSSLTNSETEVKKMAAWVCRHCVPKQRDIQYSFPSAPGYQPKAEVWDGDGVRFLLVRETPRDFGEDIDPEGDVGGRNLFYIYGWDEPSANAHRLGSEDRKALTESKADEVQGVINFAVDYYYDLTRDQDGDSALEVVFEDVYDKVDQLGLSSREVADVEKAIRARLTEAKADLRDEAQDVVDNAVEYYFDEVKEIGKEPALENALSFVDDVAEEYDLTSDEIAGAKDAIRTRLTEAIEPDAKDKERAEGLYSSAKINAMANAIKDPEKALRRGLAFIRSDRNYYEAGPFRVRAEELGATEDQLAEFDALAKDAGAERSRKFQDGENKKRKAMADAIPAGLAKSIGGDRKVSILWRSRRKVGRIYSHYTMSNGFSGEAYYFIPVGSDQQLWLGDNFHTIGLSRYEAEIRLIKEFQIKPVLNETTRSDPDVNWDLLINAVRQYHETVGELGKDNAIECAFDFIDTMTADQDDNSYIEPVEIAATKDAVKAAVEEGKTPDDLERECAMIRAGDSYNRVRESTMGKTFVCVGEGRVEIIEGAEAMSADALGGNKFIVNPNYRGGEDEYRFYGKLDIGRNTFKVDPGLSGKTRLETNVDFGRVVYAIRKQTIDAEPSDFWATWKEA